MEAEQIRDKYFAMVTEALDIVGRELEATGLAPKFGSIRFNFANGKFVIPNVEFSTPPQKKEEVRGQKSERNGKS